MPKTYNDIYIETRNILRDNGVESCALEARVITCIASGKTNTELLRDLTLYSSPEIEQAAEDMVKRRLLGEPVAYITGSWEFYGLPFAVTPDVLIPRMDTEVLVDAAIRSIDGRKMDARILDLCCGSGCIGCAIAHGPTGRYNGRFLRVHGRQNHTRPVRALRRGAGAERGQRLHGFA